MNHCGEAIIQIGGRGGPWSRTEGQAVLLSVRKLNRKVCRHYRAVCRGGVRKDLCHTEDLTVQLHLDADHLVGSPGPNRSIDFQIIGRVSGRVEINGDGEWAFFIKDNLY